MKNLIQKQNINRAIGKFLLAIKKIDNFNDLSKMIHSLKSISRALRKSIREDNEIYVYSQISFLSKTIKNKHLELRIKEYNENRD